MRSSSLRRAEDFLSRTFFCPSRAMACASPGFAAARRLNTSSRPWCSSRCSSSYSCLATCRRRRACSCSRDICSWKEFASWASRAWFARMDAVFWDAYVWRSDSVLATLVPWTRFVIISSRCSRKSSKARFVANSSSRRFRLFGFGGLLALVSFFSQRSFFLLSVKDMIELSSRTSSSPSSEYQLPSLH